MPTHHWDRRGAPWARLRPGDRVERAGRCPGHATQAQPVAGQHGALRERHDRLPPGGVREAGKHHVPAPQGWQQSPASERGGGLRAGPRPTCLKSRPSARRGVSKTSRAWPEFGSTMNAVPLMVLPALRSIALSGPVSTGASSLAVALAAMTTTLGVSWAACNRTAGWREGTPYPPQPRRSAESAVPRRT